MIRNNIIRIEIVYGGIRFTYNANNIVIKKYRNHNVKILSSYVNVTVRNKHIKNISETNVTTTCNARHITCPRTRRQ